MTADRFFTSRGRPQIYAFTEPQYENSSWTGDREGKGVGLIKVGFTERDDVTRRIWEQFPTRKPTDNPFRVLYSEDAVDKQGRFFRDHLVHKALESLGARRVNGEWFECSLDEVKTAITIVKTGRRLVTGRCQSFGLRPEQVKAVEITADYFSKYSSSSTGKAPHFLWNAKMRFGKTFTTYQLAKQMGWKRILILTFKPAVQSSWRDDLETHTDFEGWQFIGKGDESSPFSATKPLVWFASFQDILGKDPTGGIKPKFRPCYGIEWDCVVLDEYHFGSWRDAAKDLYIEEEEEDVDPSIVDEMTFPLKVRNYLYLSGTPFRALQEGEFTEDQIFNWTYTDEQRAKKLWAGPQETNPYSELPALVLMTYQMPDTLRDVANAGEFNEFSLNEFFKAKGEGKNASFIYPEAVSQWLSLIRGQYLSSVVGTLKDRIKPPLPFEDDRLVGYLQHTLWFLPSVSACEAMANLLAAPQHRFFSDYAVLVAAGNKAGMGADALIPVKQAMGDATKTKTITLTCGKLTTGVSVPPWTGIFMLRTLSSPESYFQAAFRVQTPWVLTNSDPTDARKRQILKEKCYVIDFAPDRALRLIADYSGRLDLNDNTSPETKVKEFIEFLPVLCYDGFKMLPLDAGSLLDFVVTGTASALLAKRFQSSQLINLDVDTLNRLSADHKLMAALKDIEAFRNLNKKLEAVIASEKALKKKKQNGEKLTAKDKTAERENASWRKQIRDQLLKFITRIPIFMYLTDFRETGLKDVIENIEPELFTRVTALKIDDFRRLCELNVFHSANLNSAIFAFKNYEEASLSYAGNSKAPTVYGGFDTILPRSEALEIVRASN